MKYPPIPSTCSMSRSCQDGDRAACTTPSPAHTAHHRARRTSSERYDDVLRRCGRQPYRGTLKFERDAELEGGPTPWLIRPRRRVRQPEGKSNTTSTALPDRAAIS